MTTTPPLPRASDQAAERTLFEVNHCAGNKQIIRRNEHGDYVLPSIQDAWAGFQARAAIAHSAAQAPAADPIGVAVEWPNGHIDLVRGNDNNRATSDEAWEALIAYLDSRAADGQQGELPRQIDAALFNWANAVKCGSSDDRARTRMNRYNRIFVATCPNNNEAIIYSLTIEVSDDQMIQVEHIVTATMLVKRAYHEQIADELHRRFGGRQVLRAHHHGVDIETVRGEA